jgi:hypothetical protein
LKYSTAVIPAEVLSLSLSPSSSSEEEEEGGFCDLKKSEIC